MTNSEIGQYEAGFLGYALRALSHNSSDGTMLHTNKVFLLFILAMCCILQTACAADSQLAPLAQSTIPATPGPAESTALESPTPTPRATSMPSPENPTFAPGNIEMSLEQIATDLEKPLFLTHAGDSSKRLFIVEQRGLIHIWRDGSLLPEPFLDIRDRVNDRANEQGLLGLAFPPNYVKSLEFYVNYSASAGQTRISRFSVSPTNLDEAWPDSEEVIFEVAQPASNHNGGMIAFGPNSMLWIGMGDGGGGYDQFRSGQDPQTLLAKMVRIDVLNAGPGQYTVPTDNPWVNKTWQEQDILPEIWAVGLRNPWRFSFDRETGDLWIADVGQDRFEEVNFVPAPLAGGLNFGWPIQEGNHCLFGTTCQDEGLLAPVAEISQEEGVCSITGGYVYRGKRYPAAFGGYIMGDYCSGEIWMILPPDSVGQEWPVVLLFDSDFNISSFGEGEDGELYLVAQEGQIYRLHLSAT